MIKVTEITEKQTQTDDLRNVLKQMVKELSPLYEGAVVIREYTPSNDYYIAGDHPYLYISEEKPIKRFLGVFPRTKKTMLFAINKSFYGSAFGKKDIRAWLVIDNKAEDVVKKHLHKYAENNGVTEINLTRGF